ncbi:hypothetical protein [Kitasatospora sp. NPDC048407]|uniref:hypothetical protein n=1 Tax=Kitasatospora sp. NPDC048407 TaxID=3364051 RepID=UPI0037208DD4
MRIPAVLTRRRWAALVAAGGAAAMAVAILVWPDDAPELPPLVPAMDYSGRTRLCLAFDDDDHGRATAATARSVIHDAADARTTNVQELAVPATAPKEASSYLAGLAAQHCNLIVTAGPVAANGVSALTAADPTLRFVVVDSPSNPQGPTVTVVKPQDLAQALPSQIVAVSRSVPSR